MKSRVLTSTKENFWHFQKTNLNLSAQNVWPTLMGKLLTTKPTGKCMISCELSHWGGCKSLKTFEMKFQHKVNKYLPSLIKSLDSSIMEKCNENLGKVISSIFWVFVRSEKTGRSHLPLTLFLCRTCSNTYGNNFRRQHSSTSRKDRQKPFSFEFVSIQNMFQYQWEYID